MTKLSNLIKAAMKERKLTVERLASQMTDKNGNVGITQSAASQIINGNPTFAKVEEIAKIIGVPVSDLADDTSVIGVARKNGKMYPFNSAEEMKELADKWLGISPDNESPLPYSEPNEE